MKLRYLAFLILSAFVMSKTCPDSTVCNEPSTCCQTATSFGCCPFENATCCSDQLHCCPNGYSCKDQRCINNSDSNVQLILIDLEGLASNKHLDGTGNLEFLENFSQ